MEQDFNKNIAFDNDSKSEASSVKSKLLLPISIVLAGLFIGGAIIYTNKIQKNTTAPNGQTAPTTEKIDKPSTRDHVQGDLNSGVVFVEYTDLDCPACSFFQPFVVQAVNEYAKTGKIAWVYRHMPLTQIPGHEDSALKGQAAECVAEIAGESKFFEFVNNVFAMSEEQKQAGLDALNPIYEKIGVKAADIKKCVESGKYSSKVLGQYEAAKKAGVRATPTTVVFVGDQSFPIEGATRSYDELKQIIETVLQSKPAAK